MIRAAEIRDQWLQFLEADRCQTDGMIVIGVMISLTLIAWGRIDGCLALFNSKFREEMTRKRRNEMFQKQKVRKFDEK